VQFTSGGQVHYVRIPTSALQQGSASNLSQVLLQQQLQQQTQHSPQQATAQHQAATQQATSVGEHTVRYTNTILCRTGLF